MCRGVAGKSYHSIPCMPRACTGQQTGAVVLYSGKSPATIQQRLDIRMTYQVLARKWRPGRFGDLVGQSHVLKSLTHALDNDRLHHAYLFTGTRGVGKTTLARILARCLNCEQGVSSEPCGECSACREIAEGRFIDLIEVDAASRTKVEDTRELLENVQYAPSRGRYKIYLIDEVHMLSNHSFNALLKTLEEPPPHVMFLLATTDPQKLPVTVLSRCLQFNLKSLSPQVIEAYLKDILEREGIDFEEAPLWHIATSAAGSMRDALTLLDQAISFCEGKITSAGVTAMLGTPDTAIVHELLHCLIARDAQGLLARVETAARGSADYEQLLEGLLGCLHRIAIAQALPDGVDNAYGDREAVLKLAAELGAEDVQLFYQIALKGRGDLALASDYRAMFEMLLLRMLLFAPHGIPVMPVSAAGGTAVRQESKPVGSTAADTCRQKKKPPQQPGLTRADASQEAPAASADRSRPDCGISTGEPDNPSPAPHQRAREALESVADADWIKIVQAAGLQGITGNILAHCVPVERGQGRLRLCLDRTQSAVYGEEHRLRIEQALQQRFGPELSVSIDVGEPERESPAAYSRRIRQETLEQMRDEFEADPNVQQLVERFGAQVARDTITALSKRGVESD